MPHRGMQTPMIRQLPAARPLLHAGLRRRPPPPPTAAAACTRVNRASSSAPQQRLVGQHQLCHAGSARAQRSTEQWHRSAEWQRLGAPQVARGRRVAAALHGGLAQVQQVSRLAPVTCTAPERQLPSELPALASCSYSSRRAAAAPRYSCGSTCGGMGNASIPCLDRAKPSAPHYVFTAMPGSSCRECPHKNTRSDRRLRGSRPPPLAPGLAATLPAQPAASPALSSACEHGWSTSGSPYRRASGCGQGRPPGQQSLQLEPLKPPAGGRPVDCCTPSRRHPQSLNAPSLAAAAPRGSCTLNCSVRRLIAPPATFQALSRISQTRERCGQPPNGPHARGRREGCGCKAPCGRPAHRHIAQRMRGLGQRP